VLRGPKDIKTPGKGKKKGGTPERKTKKRVPRLRVGLPQRGSKVPISIKCDDAGMLRDTGSRTYDMSREKPRGKRHEEEPVVEDSSTTKDHPCPS